MYYLDQLSTIEVLVLLTIIYLLTILGHRLFFCPLAKLPGPWLTCISTFPEANALRKQQRTEWVNTLFEQNPGAIAVRTGPNAVSFNHPDAIRTIYGIAYCSAAPA